MMAAKKREFAEEPEEYEVEPADDDLEADEVEVDLADAEPEPFTIPEESRNLVPVFEAHPEGEELLLKITESIIQYFTDDLESSDRHRRMEAENWKIFTGELKPKDGPWRNCANMHLPMMLENMTRLVMRTHGEIFADPQNIFTVQPVGPDDVQLAEAISIHDNWQLSERCPDFVRQMFRGNLSFFVHGDAIGESSWDPLLEENRHETLSKDEFVAPYMHVSTRPDMADCPHWFRIRRMYRSELQATGSAGWVHIDEVLDRMPAEHDEEPEAWFRKANDTVTKLEAPPISQEYSGTYTILQFEGWIPLLEGERDRWCKAYIDYGTRRMLKLTIHEAPSWEEMARYEAQMAEIDQYQAATESYSNALSEMESMKAMADAGQATPFTAEQVDGQIRMMPPPPAPPGWAEPDLEGNYRPPPMKKTPIRNFYHAVCIDNLTGFHGLSWGRMQADMNRVANVSMNQFSDAGTLANNWVILMSGGVAPDKKVGFAPGAWIPIRGAMAGDLQKSLMPLKPDPANPQLRETVDMMYRYAQSAVHSNDVLSGASGKSGETFRGLSARLEQALAQLSVAARMFVDQFVTPAIKNNARLNSIFMPEDRPRYLMNHKMGERQMFNPKRSWWRRLYSVQFRADMRFSTSALRIAESDEILQMVNVIRTQLGPMGGPTADMNLMVWEAAVGALKARNRHDLIPALGPRPNPPMVPMGAMPMMGAPGGMPPGQGPPGGGPPPQGSSPPGAAQ
jgi:hypothetical protein